MFTVHIYNQPLMVTIGGCKYCIFKRSSSLDKCDKSRKGCYHLELSELVIYRHNRLDILKLGWEFTTAKRLCRTRNLYIHWPSWKGNLYHPLYSSFTKIQFIMPQSIILNYNLFNYWSGSISHVDLKSFPRSIQPLTLDQRLPGKMEDDTNLMFTQCVES